MRFSDRIYLGVRIPVITLSLLIASCSAHKQSEDNNCESANAGVTISDEASLSPYLVVSTTTDSISVDQLDEQLRQEWSSGVALEAADGSNSLVAKNCIDILNLVNEVEPVRPSEFAPYQMLRAQCRAAKLISDAKPATRSCIEDLSFDRTLADKLPKDLAFLASESEKRNVQSDLEISSWSDVNTIESVEVINNEKLVFSIPGGRQELTLMAKADFNYDGNEDLLLRVINEVEGGSYTHPILYIVTKTEVDDDYRVISVYE